VITALLFSYHFPPFGGVPVQRVLRFARHLPKVGVRPVVICAQPPRAASVPLDPALLEELPPDLRVYRLKSFEPESFHNSWQHPWDKVRRNLLKTFAPWLIPDDQLLWAHYAGWRGARIAQAENAQVIWATGPPFSTLMAAAQASRKSKLPLVLDYRDDWTYIRRRRQSFAEERLVREEKLERAVFAQAKSTLTVTPNLVEDLRRRGAPEVHFVPNSFDPEHYQAQPVQPGLLFSAGSFYPDRAPEGFFRCWGGRPLRLEVAGTLHQDCRHYFPEGRNDLCHLGFLPHQEVRRKLVQAQVNVLFLDPALADQAYMGKLLECFGAGRPILLLAPLDSPTAALLHETGLGRTVAQDDLEGIGKALDDIAAGNFEVEPRPEVIARFDIGRQVEQIASLFGSLS
jgi:hypothetical protein